MLFLPWYCFVAEESDQHWCCLHSPFWISERTGLSVVNACPWYLPEVLLLFVSFPSMQTEIFAFVAYHILTSITTWVSVSIGEQYLFVYGGRSALEPVLRDWYFLHTPELSYTAVRMYSMVIRVRTDFWRTSFFVEYSLYRIVEVGRDIWRSSSPALLLKTGLTRAGCSVYCPGGIISIDGDSTISLGNLFQCLTTLIELY